MTRINKLMAFVSYEQRKKRALTCFENKLNKYLAMPDTEFYMEFINASASYEMKKFELSALSITLILTILLGIWGNVFPVIGKWLITENDILTIAEHEREAAYIATIFMTLLFAFIMLLLFYLKRQCYQWAREAQFIREVRTFRESRAYENE